MIGLVTSLFFFVLRDVYGIIVFHNFMGVLGVVQALAAERKLQGMTELQPWLLATAATAVLVLAAADKFFVVPCEASAITGYRSEHKRSSRKTEDLGLLISGLLGAALLPLWGYGKLPPAPAGVRT